MAFKLEKRWRGKKGTSPAISAVIVTGVIVTLVTVALSFATNLLVVRMAESEFSSAKQFMHTLGLQIDDVAWVIGRTETVRYSGRYGDVFFEEALNYTVYIKTPSNQDFQKLYSTTTGIVSFNMPVERYSVGYDYFELIYPTSDNTFLLSGASAPLARIFAIEKLPMTDGSFLRIVTVPTIRMVNVSLSASNYIRLYLPVLSEGESPKHSDSMTLTGQSVSRISETVTSIKIEVSFPMDEYDNSFFQFPLIEETIALADESVLELYVGTVDVALGVHY
jgi:hypothetical protein